jgi:hypothetical protein
MGLRSSYVRSWWLPVLGPTSTLLLWHFDDALEHAAVGGFISLDVGDVAWSLGVMPTKVRDAVKRLAWRKCIVVEAHGEDALISVPNGLGPVRTRDVARWPDSVRDEHERQVERLWVPTSHQLGAVDRQEEAS